MSALPKLTKAAGLLRDLAATLSHVDIEHLSQPEAFFLADLRGMALEHAKTIEQTWAKVYQRTQNTHDAGLVPMHGHGRQNGSNL